MTRFILVFAFLFTILSSYSQTYKAGVAVFGTTPFGIAAAIQSAHSGVKTVLIDEGSFDIVNLTEADKAYKLGIYKKFTDRVDSLQKNSNLKNNHSLIPAYAATVFKGWTDTIKNLTVLKKAVIKQIEKDGKRWEIEFKDRREIKADIIIDATTGSIVAKSVGAKPGKSLADTAFYKSKLYRTAIGIPAEGAEYVPAKAILSDGTENFLLPPPGQKPSLLLGQGAGAMAAFCAFFEVNTEKLDIRRTQGEILGFKSHLINFNDVSVLDSNAVSIQRIAVTGILKGKVADNRLLFMPDSTVSSEDIRSPVREYYSRSQIWFLDHKAEKLTLEETLSLIKFTANRGKELDKEVEKGWNTYLRLSGKFDLKHYITRKELAVLFDAYLKPFDRSVDLEGNLKR